MGMAAHHYTKLVALSAAIKTIVRYYFFFEVACVVACVVVGAAAHGVVRVVAYAVSASIFTTQVLLSEFYCTATRNTTEPDCIAFSTPVSVHNTLPDAPTIGCVVALQAVMAIGNALQFANTKVVKAGVLSLITTIESAAFEVLV